MRDEKVDAHWATPLALAEHSRKIQPCHAETFHGVNTEWNEWAQGDNPG